MKSARRPKQNKTYREGPKVRKPQPKKRYVKKELDEMKLENYPLEYELTPADPYADNDSLFTA